MKKLEFLDIPIPMVNMEVINYGRSLREFYDRHLKDKWIVDASELIKVGLAFDNGKWYTYDGDDCHTGYLIGIEPIKQESCADVLRDVVRMGEGGWSDPVELGERAKAALERENGEGEL